MEFFAVHEVDGLLQQQAGPDLGHDAIDARPCSAVPSSQFVDGRATAELLVELSFPIVREWFAGMREHGCLRVEAVIVPDRVPNGFRRSSHASSDSSADF